MNFFEIPIGLDYGYHWINQNNKTKKKCQVSSETIT